MENKVQHKIGEEVDMDVEVAGGPLPAVPRLAGKHYSVIVGSSCTMCDFTGLGHVLCPSIACSSSERDDFKSVVYREIK